MNNTLDEIKNLMSQDTQWSIKYRPQTLDDVFGQPVAVKALKQCTKEHKFPGNILIRGPFGTGKTTLAHIIAATIQCQNPNPDGSPCGHCKSCQDILSENFSRNTEVLDGSQLGQKDSIVQLSETLSMPALYDNSRVIIIEEADQLSPAAKVAMLKILERPLDPNPKKRVYFILLSMIKNGIPAAIKSRCQTYDLKPVSIKDTMYALKAILEKERLWNDASIPQEFKLQGLGLIATMSKGSLREAVQNMELCVRAKLFDPKEITESFGTVNELATYQILNGLLTYSKDEDLFRSISEADPEELRSYILKVLSSVILYKKTGYAGSEYIENTVKMASMPGVDSLFRLFTTSPLLQKPITLQSDILATVAMYYDSGSGATPTLTVSNTAAANTAPVTPPQTAPLQRLVEQVPVKQEPDKVQIGSNDVNNPVVKVFNPVMPIRRRIITKGA